jgi:hypothetical protein
MPKQKKPRPAKAPPWLPEQLRPYVGKHPAELILEHYETQARKLLKAEGLPADLSELMGWHDPPREKKEREQWLKNFKEHHLKFFPGDRGKILKPRQAALRGVLFEAEKAREAIAAGDPKAAAMHSHRLAVEATKTDLALYGEVQAERGQKPKEARGIWYAIEEKLKTKNFENFSQFWEYLRLNHYRIEKMDKQEDKGISIERKDFSGEVYYDPDTGKLCEEPAALKKSKRQDVTILKAKRLTKRAVERYFSRIKKSLR